MKIHEALISAVALSAALAPVPALARGGDRVPKPGDRITVTTIDGATGTRQTVTATVNGTLTAGPAVSASRGTVVFRQIGTPMEFLALDPSTRRLTVLDEHGERKVLYVDEPALAALSGLEPGERFFLSYRFNEDAQAEALIHPWPPAVTRGALVSVEAADLPGKTLAFRDTRGVRHTLVVDHDAARDLRGLRQGDTVLIAFRDDHVVAITRK